MPLPSNTDQAKIDTAYLGQPFVQVEAKTLGTTSLDVAYLGQPFVAVGPAVVSGFAVWANVSGVWKVASAIYVNVSGTWKTATAVRPNVSGTWKS